MKETELHGDSLVNSLREQLERAALPETLSSLQKKFRKTPIETALVALKGEGAVFEWPPVSKTKGPRYWTKRPREAVQEAARTIVGKSLLLKKDLFRKVGVAAMKPAEDDVRIAVGDMMREGSLQVVTVPGSRSERVGDPRQPGPILEAYRKAFEVLLAQLRQTGVSDEAVAQFVGGMTDQTKKAQADPMEDLGHRIYSALLAEEPIGGVTASIPKIRARAEFRDVSKADFDQASLWLYTARRVFLNYHDYPQSLPESERDSLVFDGDKTWYVGITAR